MSKLVHTKGIVLRSVPYSETSVVCTIYTEEMGTKGYIISGVRTTKKTASKASFFQPGALLDLVVYDSDFQHLHRIKEFKWDYLYQQVFFNVFRNAGMLFSIELLSRTLRQPDHNPALFQFARATLQMMDTSNKETFANLPLYFSVHLLSFLGFKIHLPHLKQHTQSHLPPLDEALCTRLEGLLQVAHIKDVEQLKMNKYDRHQLFEWLHSYYRTHVHDFGTMKSYAVIKQIFE